MLIVAASMASLKVALTTRVRQTPALRSGGLTALTVGGVTSAVAEVVKVQTWLPAAGSTAWLPASALPARSVAAEVTVALKAELLAKVPPVGVKVTVRAAGA